MSAEKILIVEDEHAVARGLQYGLEAEGFKTFVADSGRGALEIAQQESPHLILLDIRLPDMSGFDVLRHLRHQGFIQPILILTARDEEVDKVLGLELGADDYVVKPYQLRELIARVHALLRRAYGEFAIGKSAGRLSFGDVVMDSESLQVTRGKEPVYLTPTEFRLLHHLVSSPKHPMSRATLIEAVWGYEGEIGSDRTIDVHIRHLREKLERDPSEPRYIVTVRGVGYKFEPDA
jgi:DNA-binding response OmpR family regulator